MVNQDPDTAYDDARDQRDDEDMVALEKMGIPREAERFNTQGTDGRDCPVCLTRDKLAGLRDGDRPELTCRLCRTRFVLIRASANIHQDTLVRATPRAPAAPYVPVAERGR